MNKSNSNLALVILVVMIQLSVGDLVVMVIQQLFARIVIKEQKKSRGILSF